MNLANYYSLIILPPDEVIALVGKLKLRLHTESGKGYSSRKSMAHITIQEFWATENQLKKIILKLIKIAREEKGFAAVFDEVFCSEQTAFFTPDDISKGGFKRLLERIRTQVKGKCKSNAHISIGRKLSSEQLEISRKIFSTETLEFNCNRIALRKFNDKTKQFEVVQTFSFLGEESSEKQLTLW